MKNHFLSAILLLVTLCSQNAQALTRPSGTRNGIAGGNHLTSSDFDFRMRLSMGWLSDVSGFRSTVSVDNPAYSWTLSNHAQPDDKDASWMNVDFYSTIPAQSREELAEYLKQAYPHDQWREYEDTHLTGFISTETSDPIEPQARIGHIAYFMDRRMIVMVTWRRHPAQHGDRDVTEMLMSMDRSTAKPIVKFIHFSPADHVVAGQPMCVHIGMDALKSSFETKGLLTVNFSGMPKHKIFENASWNEQSGQFDLCFDAPTNITTARDLIISNMSIRSTSSDESVYCELRAPATQLSCGNFGQSATFIPQNPPIVENQKPDLDPPSFHGVELRQSGRQVTVQAHVSDASNIAGGWLELRQIPGSKQKLFIGPWDHSSGLVNIDLTPYSTNGTRRVSQILLSDTNSLTSTLIDCSLVVPGAMTSCKAGYYAYCIENKNCVETDMPVIEYFSQRQGKN